MDERTLINGILSGRTELFAQLLRGCQQQVYAMLFRLVGNAEDAEELAQDAFVRAYEHLGEFDFRASFSTWVCAIAYRLAISHLRKRRPMAHVEDFSEAQLSAVSDQQAAEMLSDTSEHRLNRLRKALGSLSADDQLLIQLFYFDRQSLRNISFILDLPAAGTARAENTVAVRISRIRKKLFLKMRN